MKKYKITEESLDRIVKKMDEICLARIVIEGNLHSCELPKYHDGWHYVEGGWFIMKWRYGED